MLSLLGKKTAAKKTARARADATLLRAALAAAVALISAGAVVTSHAAAQEGPQVAAADAFVDAIGVDSHFDRLDSPYDTEWPALRDALIASGIRHIRDGNGPNPQYVERLAELGRHGILHEAGFNIHATPEIIRAHMAAFAPYLEFVEAPNEYDGERAKDPDWAAHLVDFQKMLYTTVRSDSASAGIKVLGPALARQELYPLLGVLDQYEDAGNLHFTTCDRNPENTDVHRSMAWQHSFIRLSTQTKPIWTTETGYNDDMVRPCALGDDTIAKYDPRVVAERWNAGEQRIYFYQYADMPSDRVFGGMGLMRADASPKPQFTALVSMIHLLADPGPAFVPKPLNFGLGGDAAGVAHTLLEKRDGRYELLLWLEAPSWDPKTRAAFSVAPQTVTLSLPTGITSGKIYSYTPNWTLAATPLQLSGGSARVRVTDAISFVELTP
jgi:hypothetical protein